LIVRFDIPNTILNDGLKDGLYSAAAFAIAQSGNLVASGTVGCTSFDDDALAIGPHTLFDVASITKPVITATAALQLVEDGRLTLVQTAAKSLEICHGLLPHLESVDIRHLLTHTSGLPPIPRKLGSDDEKVDRARAFKAAMTTVLLRDPGQAYTYSDVGYLVLGEIVALAAGESLEKYAAKSIFAPLGMSSSKFCPTGPDIVKTDPAVKPGTVHDPRARELGGVAGHAGLFSACTDLMLYAEAIRTGGAPILSRASVARMAKNQLSPGVGAMSYGWFCAGNDLLPRGDLFSDEAFGHSGFTGCILLIDPTYETSIVLLTNRVLNTSADGVPFLKLRRRWLNTVAAVLTRI
jgi:CubicO group peptidase (beta-lactamase class C family)